MTGERRKTDRRVSPAVVEYSIGAFERMQATIAEQAREIERLSSVIDKAWNRSHTIGLDAYIPGALDAWKRPVLQHLPYDFSGNPGASATQYCNGWNDAGGYWKAYSDDLLAEIAGLKSQPCKMPPEVAGIGRDSGHPRAVVLYLRKEPDDYDIRAIQECLRRHSAALKAHPSGVVVAGMADALRHVIKELDEEACEDIDYAQVSGALGAYELFGQGLNSSPVSAGGVDERAAKGSRKALGAVNAKLKAKVGRLEREISGLKGRHSEKDYREGFESWGRREGVALWPNPKNPETYYCGAAQKAAEAFKAGAEWKACAATPASSADDMADRFISWPLPDSVRPDPCAMNPEYPHRYGTNLMTWAQAKAMFEYVLSAPSAGSGD